MNVVGTSENWGVAQERLSAVPALISGSRLRAPVGPGIEFLQYLTPKEGRPLPTDTSVEDLWSEVIAMHANGSRTARILHDPDGHAVAGALVTTG